MIAEALDTLEKNNDITNVDADSLNRVVKMAIDSGEAATIQASYELFRTYRVTVLVGPELRDSAVHQATLLTIVNIARRALLGGVFIVGLIDAPLCVPLPGCTTLFEAIAKLGGRMVAEAPAGAPALILGTVHPASCGSRICLTVTFQDWRGGVIPTGDGRRLEEAGAIMPAAVLAGALGVSEVFQELRGNPMAGRRSVGLSLWSPEHLDWERAPAGPTSIVLPSRLWLIGLGHLGQAYLWTLGLLPYKTPEDVELVLQDFDHITKANDSTSLLTDSCLTGRRKTRVMAAWAEARGFRTRVVERVFPGGMKLAADEPRLALGGVDNPLARAAYEDVGFDWVVEAGLGAGPVEYLALRMHSFPASTTAREKWRGAGGVYAAQDTQSPAYTRLAEEGMDRCGLVRLASRTVGAPFVGVTASTFVVAEVLRRLNGGPGLEVVDLTLRDPASREVVQDSNRVAAINPGFTR